MSKKSSTFAPFKVKIYEGNRMSCRKRAVFFMPSRLYANGFSIGYPVHLAVMAVRAFVLGL